MKLPYKPWPWKGRTRTVADIFAGVKALPIGADCQLVQLLDGDTGEPIDPRCLDFSKGVGFVGKFAMLAKRPEADVKIIKAWAERNNR